MTRKPPARLSRPPTPPGSPAPAHGDGPTGPSTPTSRTEPLPSGRDPRELVGIYLADSLDDIATAGRILARAGLSDLALDNVLDTARIALESARRINEELSDHA